MKKIVTFGEIMLRLDPGEGRVRAARQFQVWEGGGEYNVARGLRRCFGLRTAVCTAFAENDVGRLLEDLLLQGGVNMEYVKWAPFDGIGRKVRVGLNFTERGFGLRGAVGCSDRANSAASQLKKGDIDWERIFGADGVRWFHTGGIFAALSDSCAAVTLEALEAAHRAGTVTSYDLNFRSKLWSSARAIEVTRRLMPHIDVLIGNEEDFQKVLGFAVEGTDESLAKLPVEGYKKMVERVVAAYPGVRAVGTTLREVVSGLVNNWSAIMYVDGQFYGSRRYEHLEIEDRVGGGDGFCSGFVYGFLHGKTPQECVELGAAHGALLQSTRGDTSMVTMDEVKHVMKGGSARIKR